MVAFFERERREEEGTTSSCLWKKILIEQKGESFPIKNSALKRHNIAYWTAVIYNQVR